MNAASESSDNTPHDDFDWTISKRNTLSCDSEEKQALDAFYESSFLPIEEGEITTGTIAKISKQEVIVTIGYKSDGIIASSEFRDMPDLKVGDEVEVLVIEKEDKNGYLKLSRKLAVLERAWQKIKKLYESGEVVRGHIVSKTKGGLIATIHGFDTFVPGSQIDVKPITDYDQFVGKIMEFKIVKINEHIRNAVVSHKILIEHDMAAQHSEIMGKLEKGQIMEGMVKNITDFGAFLDLGGIDGLLYITDISYGRISHPSEALSLDQKLNVVILDFDENKRRISLGLKQLSPNPWDSMPESITEGAKVKGKVVNVEDYGSFLEIMPGLEGLVHVSEITWENVMINSREFFKLGEYHDVIITRISKEEKKISLSIKRLLPDPWDNIETLFPVGTRHSGIVKNITQYNIFVELASGIGGFVHISDLSWIKRISHPSKFCKMGTTLDVIVLNIDKAARKLQLGHKQIEDNPWATLETIFKIGSTHEGTVIKKDDKGNAIVSLPYGIEAFCPAKHLVSKDKSPINAGDTLSFMITSFEASEKRIIISHSNLWEQDEKLEKEQAKKKESPRRTKYQEEIAGYTA